MSQFDSKKFIEVLSSSNGFSSAQRAALVRAARIANGEIREIKIGDLYRSSRGVRMVVRISNTTYGLVSVKSFSPHEEAGMMLCSRDGSMTLSELEQYVAQHNYERVGHITETAPASILSLEE